RRVEEFLERPRVFEPAGHEPLLQPGPVGVEFEHVSVRASSGAAILSGIDLRIDPGTHIALAGPAGCGKSTAIQLILREFTPSDEGQYLSGPLVDNLVWVGLREIESLSLVAVRLLESLSGDPLLEQLLEFGRAQILTDQTLRVRTAERAPDLQALLPSRPSGL